MRIGHGYDAHRFGGNRPFIIGGVHVPYSKMLDAHSDGDTLAHAVIDALFGAAGMQDIGTAYPDSSDLFDNADSMTLLADAAHRVRSAGFGIEYIDCTIVAQAPRMSPYISAMRTALASACCLDVSRVNVKATTEEHMGFTGNGTGISAHAVCLLNE